MITFQKETGKVFEEDSPALYPQHYEEMAEYTDKIKLDPMIGTYWKLYNAGKLEIHSVRDNGNLVGYNVWMIGRYIHAQGSKTASSDMLYLLPEYRKGLLGFRFLKWSLDEIKKSGAQRIIFHVKVTRDYGPLVERLGAKLIEKSYMVAVE